MHMLMHPCAQATVKMEPDREIESSETEMETNEETFERDASAVPEGSPCEEVKRQSCSMAVFWVRNGVEHGQRPRSAGILSLSCTRKTKHANTSNLYSHLKKHHLIE